MRIALLCATQRGYLFLKKLTDLLPGCDMVVFSFREEAWEPPFLDQIRKFTLSKGGQFFEARQVGEGRWQSFWQSIEIDLMFVISWRYLIPAHVYQRPRIGTFVFHDSLLPEYRGFSPTVWAIVNGEDHTGVTLFEIAEGVDSGDIIDQKPVSIGIDDVIGVVLERVTQTYLNLLERNLERLISGTAPRYSQDHSRASYTCKRLPEDNQIDWTVSTKDIYNLIRAVSRPYPGAYTYLSDKKIRVWSAKRLPKARHFVGRIPGRVAEIWPNEGSVVLTGDGALLLTEIQMEEGEVVYASDLLNSISYTLG